MPYRDEMVSAMLEELFDDTLLNQVYGKITEGHVGEGMSNLVSGLMLRRQNSSDQEWAEFVSMCLHHPIKELVHQDPFTHRAFTKPRGYAGDAVLLDYIYGREEHWPLPEGISDLGRQIFEYTTAAHAPEGVRARREFIANLLDQMVEAQDRPHVLSIAAGHLREVILSSAVRRRKLGRFVALDSDIGSLEEVDRCYSCYGVEVVPASIRQLLSHKAVQGDFDLVYSTGLFDYLQASTAQRLTSTMFEMLRPRGRLLVANFLPGIADIGYMESFMDWKLLYRTRHEMLEVSAGIPQADIRDIRIFTEENQNIIFLQITKR
jgi:extracellular factor (EF) 3-hydroxypalmitic acid methyl ester biosynthesis protein